jgi:RND family efflux transporter MFP subunit
VGQVEAVQSADVAFEKMSDSAELLSLSVEAGSVVTAGQVLATIDATPYQQALDEATTALQAAEETVADLETPPTDLEIAQGDLAVSQAEVQLQAAVSAYDDLANPDIASLKVDVERAKLALAQAEATVADLEDGSSTADQMARLREADSEAYAVYYEWANKAHSDSDEVYNDQLTVLYNKMMNAQDALVTAELEAKISLLQAQMTVRQDEAALAEAQEALAEAQAGGDALTLAQAKLAVQNAQVALQQAQLTRTQLSEGADATTLATAQANLAKQQLAVSDAQAALDGTTLVSPFDATILETYVSTGDQVSANTSILSLANLNSLQVVASIDETTIRQVSAGQSATISFDAYPDQTFQGTVLSVPLQGSLQGDVTVYEVSLSLSGADDLDLLVGMTANVDIETGLATDALLVPTLAVQKVNGAYQVSVPNTTDPNGDPETIPVEIGVSNGTYTQIVKGLNAGDQVIVTLDTSSTESTLQGMGGPGGDMGSPPSGSPPSLPGGANQ